MKIGRLVIFTNGSCMAFDEKETQMPKTQGNIHKLDMNSIINDSAIIEISKWGEWIHELSRQEAIYLFVGKEKPLYDRKVVKKESDLDAEWDKRLNF